MHLTTIILLLATPIALASDDQQQDDRQPQPTSIPAQIIFTLKHFLKILGTSEHIYRILLRDLVRADPTYRQALEHHWTVAYEPVIAYLSYILGLHRPSTEDVSRLIHLALTDTGPLRAISDERVDAYKAAYASLLDPLLEYFGLAETSYETVLKKLHQEVVHFRQTQPIEYQHRLLMMASIVSIALPRMIVELEKDRLPVYKQAATQLSDDQLAIDLEQMKRGDEATESSDEEAGGRNLWSRLKKNRCFLLTLLGGSGLGLAIGYYYRSFARLAGVSGSGASGSSVSIQVARTTTVPAAIPSSGPMLIAWIVIITVVLLTLAYILVQLFKKRQAIISGLSGLTSATFGTRTAKKKRKPSDKKKKRKSSSRKKT